MSATAPLGGRLFGYGILYRAALHGEAADVSCTPVATEAALEARALAETLARHVDARAGSPPPAAAAGEGEMAISVPFGRCGIDGRPREHVRLYQFEEAFIDTLSSAGPATRSLAEGETVLVEPGSIVRFRARPQPGQRVLAAFQTEDRTPLLGHAAPLTAAGESPADEAGARLRQTTEAFRVLRQGLLEGDAQATARLENFFGGMARRVEGDAQIAAARSAAIECGSYETGDSPAAFDGARALLTPAVLERIAAADPQLFRYPGMFGAVAPLFPLLDPV